MTRPARPGLAIGVGPNASGVTAAAARSRRAISQATSLKFLASGSPRDCRRCSRPGYEEAVRPAGQGQRDDVGAVAFLHGVDAGGVVGADAEGADQAGVAVEMSKTTKVSS